MISRAYESAIEILQIQNTHVDRRAALARCVMNLAECGETDEMRLRDAAVAAVRRSDRIRDRAHEIWEREGRPDGQHAAHWRRAEQELGEHPETPLGPAPLQAVRTDGETGVRYTGL